MRKMGGMGKMDKPHSGDRDQITGVLLSVGISDLRFQKLGQAIRFQLVPVVRGWNWARSLGGGSVDQKPISWT